MRELGRLVFWYGIIPAMFVCFVYSLIESFCMVGPPNFNYRADIKLIAGIVVPICWLLNFIEEFDDDNDIPEDLKEAFYGDKDHLNKGK